MKNTVIMLFVISLIYGCKDSDNNDHPAEEITPVAHSETKISADKKIHEKSLILPDLSIDPEVVASIYQHKNRKYGYRLGDMFSSPPNRLNPSTGEPYHLKYFPDSIASDYMRQTELYDQYDILLPICESRLASAEIPPQDTLVIHLRIGDMLDTRSNTITEFLTTNVQDVLGPFYIKPLMYYQTIINKLRNENYPINAIELVGGFHRPIKSREKSLQYVSAIKRFFTAEGFSVTTRIDHPTDDDVLYTLTSPLVVEGSRRLLKIWQY